MQYKMAKREAKKVKTEVTEQHVTLMFLLTTDRGQIKGKSNIKWLSKVFLATRTTSKLLGIHSPSL